jgi:predicted DNA-binding ribbon-helix-helix protein
MTEPTVPPTEAVNPSDIAAGLPVPAAPAIVSEMDTSGADMGQHREGFTSVSFTSIPQKGYDQLKDIARQRGVFPRDLFSEAVRQFLAERKAGEVTYLASRKGGVRRAMWLEDDLIEAMKAAAEQDNVTQTEFFLAALRRFAEKEGLDVEI